MELPEIDVTRNISILSLDIEKLRKLLEQTRGMEYPEDTGTWDQNTYTDFVDDIEKMLDSKVTLFSNSVAEPLGYSLIWAIVFFLVAIFIFSRKQILH